MDQAITCAARNDLMTGTGAPRPIGSPVYEAQARAAAAWATGRSWSILLTSANHGTVGPLGSTFSHAGEHHERVVVVEVPAGAGAPSDQVNLVLRAAPATEASASTVLTDERIYKIAEGNWDTIAFARAIEREVAAQAGQIAPTELHDAIMRISADEKEAASAWVSPRIAYLAGHRDARHAAADLAAGAAAGQVAVPEGWKLVPVEPTLDMVTHGFESAPHQHFSPAEEWAAYAKLTGCQQAAHRARLCYAAMLAAAPSAPVVAQQAPMAVDGVRWDLFPGYLIDHCEGDVLSEEGLQSALAGMLKDPQYLATVGAQASTAGERQEGGAA